MLLKEMFSAIGAPKEEEQNIDWIDDLKFFIDNDTEVLSKNFFPAIKKHQEHHGNPNAFKIYIRPIESAVVQYCDKFKVDNQAEKFPKEALIDLAKRFAEEQEKHIEKGDYK